jgi:myxalamid-type polyketide synthase MxaE and MxaD
MAAQGAGQLVLVGRSEPSEAAQKAIEAMRAQGADVVVARADVARREELEPVFAAIAQRGAAVRGVVHAAAVLDDRTALELDGERFMRVMAPKVYGAWNLHELVADQSWTSSCCIRRGYRCWALRAGNYAAANAFLDALAHHRERAGRRG